jgi:dCMP deaminase
MKLSKKKLDNYYKQALVVSELSPDQQTKVGALLISSEDGAILGSGYNGFVRGGPDEALPKTRPDKYKFIIHSEVNLLCNCIRNRITTKNCFVFCTLSPCINCLRQLYQANINVVYFKDKYRDFEENLNMLDLKIDLEESNGYYKITTSPREIV